MGPDDGESGRRWGLNVEAQRPTAATRFLREIRRRRCERRGAALGESCWGACARFGGEKGKCGLPRWRATRWRLRRPWHAAAVLSPGTRHAEGGAASCGCWAVQREEAGLVEVLVDGVLAFVPFSKGREGRRQGGRPEGGAAHSIPADSCCPAGTGQLGNLPGWHGDGMGQQGHARGRPGWPDRRSEPPLPAGK